MLDFIRTFICYLFPVLFQKYFLPHLVPHLTPFDLQLVPTLSVFSVSLSHIITSLQPGLCSCL